MMQPSALNYDPQWFKDAIIYEVPVRAFSDSNNDGIGDFRGLTEKLDYLQTLGVTMGMTFRTIQVSIRFMERSKISKTFSMPLMLAVSA
jgi:hypothetical protein